MRTIANTTENIGGICFGIGSFVFFYLFFQSRYIPKVFAALGLIASAIWTTSYFANLIFRNITPCSSTFAFRRWC